MVYVDHPPPTGFSECLGVCEWDDASQAVLGRLFYEAFFKAYPELLKGKSQFYLAGESYAGILVPTIAKEILQPTKHHAHKGQPSARLPLQGIMLNNACAGNEEEACPAYGRTPNWAGARAYIEFQRARQMLSEDMYTRIRAACAGHWGPAEPPAACKNLLTDPYWPAPEQSGNADLMGGGYYLFNPNGRLANQMSLSQRWLDLKEVREALHVANVTRAFQFVTVPQNYGYTAASLVRTYQRMLVPNLRILHLSGDSDPCVPTESTLAWIRKLGLGTLAEWSPYWAPQGLAVAGYETRYTSNFTFATIRNAGHMVASQRPFATFHAAKQFLANRPLRDTRIPIPHGFAEAKGSLC